MIISYLSQGIHMLYYYVYSVKGVIFRSFVL